MFCNIFGGGPRFMMIPMLLILLLGAYFIYKAINGKRLNSIPDTSLSKAMDILDERFAKGEINEEEYNSRKNQLRK